MRAIDLPASEKARAICVVTSVLWIAALGFAALGWISMEYRDVDTGVRSSDTGTAATAWIISIVLVASSGPAAYAIGRDRRLLALPVVGIAVAALGALLSAVRLLPV